MEKKRLTADQILKQKCPWLIPDGNYDDTFIAAMQEFASQDTEAKDERIKTLEEALRDLVNAVPEDASWNYPAAWEQARQALQPTEQKPEQP